MDALKQVACDAVDSQAGSLHDLSKEIWQHRELAFEEHKSHATLTRFLQEAGFTVEAHYKLETAFVARWGNFSANQGKPFVARMMA